MKNYKKQKQWKQELFKRLTGVQLDTFKAILQECELFHERKKSKGGKPNKLSNLGITGEFTLSYFNEKQTLF